MPLHDIDPDEDQEEPEPILTPDPGRYFTDLGPLIANVSVGFRGRRDFPLLARPEPERDERGEIKGGKGGGSGSNPFRLIALAVSDLFGLTPETDLTPGQQDIDFDITDPSVYVPDKELDDDPATQRVRAWKRMFENTQRDTFIIPLLDNLLKDLGIPVGIPGLGAPDGARTFITRVGAEEAGIAAPAVNSTEKFVDLLLSPLLGGLIPGVGSFLGARAVLLPILRAATGQKAIRQALKLGVASGRKTETLLVRAGMKAAKEAAPELDKAAQFTLAMDNATQYAANVLADVVTGSAFLGLYGAAEAYDTGTEFENPGVYLALGAVVGGVLGFPGHLPRLLRGYRNIGGAIERGFIRTADGQEFLKNLKPGFTTESGKVFRGLKKNGTPDWRYAAGVRDAQGKPLATRKVPDADLPFTIGPDGQYNDVDDAAKAILQTQLSGVEAALKRRGFPDLASLKKGKKLEEALAELDKLDGLENIMATGAPVEAAQSSRGQAERAATRVKKESHNLADVIGNPDLAKDPTVVRAVSSAIGTRVVLAERFAKDFIKRHINNRRMIKDWINMLDFHVENNSVLAERIDAAAISDALKAAARREGLDLEDLGVRKPATFMTPHASRAEEAASRIYAMVASTPPGMRNSKVDELLREFANTRSSARGRTGAERREVADRVLARVAELRQENAIRDLDLSDGLFGTSLYDNFAGADRGLFIGAKVQLVDPQTGFPVNGQIVSTPINGIADVRVPGTSEPIRMPVRDLTIIDVQVDDVVFLKGNNAPAIVTGVDLEGGVKFNLRVADPETGEWIRRTVTPDKIESIAVSESRLRGASPITAARARIVRGEIFDRMRENVGEKVKGGAEFTLQEPELINWDGNLWEEIGFTKDGDILLRHPASGIEMRVTDKEFVAGLKTGTTASEPVLPMKTATRDVGEVAVPDRVRVDKATFSEEFDQAVRTPDGAVYVWDGQGWRLYDEETGMHVGQMVKNGRQDRLHDLQRAAAEGNGPKTDFFGSTPENARPDGEAVTVFSGQAGAEQSGKPRQGLNEVLSKREAASLNRKVEEHLASQASRTKKVPVVADEATGGVRAAVDIETYKEIPVIRKSLGDDGPGAQFNRETGQIEIDEEGLQRAWERFQQGPEAYRIHGVDPPDTEINTFDDFRAFTMEHERQHAALTKRTGESVVEYENRVNRAAVDVLKGDDFGPRFAKAPLMGGKPGEVRSFRGTLSYLSNFHPAKVKLDGIEYPSVENAYQAAKTLDPNLRKPFESGTPVEALRRGRKLEQRPDWVEVKDGVMKDLLDQKFQDPQLKARLLKTGTERLSEVGPTDKYWGVVKQADGSFEGQDKLGLMLEDIRGVAPTAPAAPAVKGTIHSGAAKGSDTVWEEIGAELGYKVKAHVFEGLHPTNKFRVEHSAAELLEADQFVNFANETLKRPIKPGFVQNLFRRNYFQIKDSDQVIAIGKLQSNQKIVDGGTGWAVQMGIDKGVPVHIFDQTTNQWYTWGGDSFYPGNVPTPSANFAGIGTRQISKRGREEIRKVLTGGGAAPAAPASVGPVKKRIPMNFVFGRSGALPAGEGVSAANTFDAILDGTRTATSRKDGSLRDVEVGDVLEFFNRKKQTVKVRVTGKRKAGDVSPEEWARAEGYDVEATRANWTAGQKFSEYEQITYERLGGAPAPPTPTGPPIKPNGPLSLTPFTANQRPHTGHRVNYTKVPTALAKRMRVAIDANDRSELFSLLTEAPGAPRDRSGFSLRMLAPIGDEKSAIFAFEIPSKGVFRTDRSGPNGKYWQQLQRFIDSGVLPKDDQAFFTQHFGYRADAIDRIGGIYEVPNGITSGNFGTPEIRNLDLTDKGVVKALQAVLKRQINGNLDIPPELAAAMRGVKEVGVREQAALSAEQVLPMKSDFSLKEAIKKFLIPGTEPLNTEQGIKARIAAIGRGMEASRMWRSWNPEQLRPHAERLFGTDSPLQPLLKELQDLVDSVQLPERPQQSLDEPIELFYERFAKWKSVSDRAMNAREAEFTDAVLRTINRLGMTGTLDGDNIVGLKSRTVPGLEMRFRLTDRTTKDYRAEAMRLARLARGRAQDLIYDEIPLPVAGRTTRPRLIVELHHPSGKVDKVDLGAVPGIPEEGMSRLVRESQRARVDSETLYAGSVGEKAPVQIYWERLQASQLGLPAPTDRLPYMRRGPNDPSGLPDLRGPSGISITYDASEAATLRSGALGEHLSYKESFSNVIGKRVRDVQGGRLRGEIDQARFTTDEFGNPVEPFSELDERELITVALEKRRAAEAESVGSTIEAKTTTDLSTNEFENTRSRAFVSRTRGVGDPDKAPTPVSAADPDPDRLTDNVRVIWETDSGETIFLDPSGKPMVQLEEGLSRPADLFGADRPKIRRTDLQIDEAAIDRVEVLPGLEGLAGRVAVEQGADPARLKPSDIRRALDDEISPEIRESLQGLDPDELRAVLDELDPFIGRRATVISGESQQVGKAGILDNISVDDFGGEFVELSSTRARQGRQPFTYFFPQPPRTLREQAFELSKMLHGFDVASGRRLSVGEFLHPTHPSLHAQVRVMKSGQYRVVMQDAADKTYYESLEVPGGNLLFSNARSAVEFLHNTGFIRNKNPAIFGDFNHLAHLPEPSEMGLREIVEMNREIASAIEIYHGQTGDVPQPLIDYANDFVDNGWGRLLPMDKEVLLFGKQNRALIGRRSEAGLEAPRGVDSDALPLPIGETENFAIVEGNLIQLATDDEMARINNAIYRKNYPNMRELRNLPAEIRQRNLEAIGEDAAQAERFLGMAHLDFNRNVGPNPNFNPIGELDWMAYPVVMIEKNGKTIPGILKLSGYGPGVPDSQVYVFNSKLGEFVEQSVPKANISQSLRPGDMWDMRSIDGFANANYRPELRRTPGRGDSPFDRRLGLEDPDQVRFPTAEDYVTALDEAAMTKIYSGKVSPFVTTDDVGIPGIKRGPDIDEQSLTDITDYYLRRIEAGSPLTPKKMLEQMNEAGTHAKLLQAEVDEFHEGIKGLAYLRDIQLRSGGVEDAASTMIAKAKLGFQSVESEETIRRQGRIIIDGLDADRVFSEGVKPPPKGKTYASDDMASWEIMERIFQEGVDREVLQEQSENITESMIRKLWNDEAGFLEFDFGKVKKNFSELFGNRPNVTFSDPKPPKIRVHFWNMPATIAQKNPTLGFYNQNLTRAHMDRNIRGRDLKRWLVDYMQTYDPDDKALGAWERMRAAGFRDYDDFMERGSPEQRKAIIPGDGILRQSRTRREKLTFKRPENSMSFEKFARAWDEKAEGGRRDHMRSFLEMRWAPATVTKANFLDADIQSSLAFNGGRFHPYDIGGKKLKNDAELKAVLDAGGQVRIFGFSNDAVRGNLRPSDEVNYFIENMIADSEFRSVAQLEPGASHAHIGERIRAMKGEWDWMKEDFDFWDRDYMLDDGLPEVLRGKLRIYAKAPGEDQAKLIGFAPSVTEANLALRGWAKQIPDLPNLTRPEDAADREFLETIKAVMDADEAGFHFIMEDLRVETREVMDIGVGRYEHLLDVIGRDGAMDPRAIMHLLKQTGLETAQRGRPIPSGFPKRGDGVVRSWFGGDPYRKWGLYFSKINEATHRNNVMKITRQTMDVDELISDAYGIPSLFKKNKEAALSELGDVVQGIPVSPSGVQVGEHRYPGVQKWMDQMSAIAMGEPGPREKQMDEWLTFWYWLEDNVNGFGRRVAEGVTGKDFAWRDFVDADPRNFRRHYRPFGARSTFQNMMHVQAIVRLGFSPAAAMVNFSQWLVNSAPLLGAENTAGALRDWRVYVSGSKKLRNVQRKHGPEWRQKYARGEISDPLLEATSDEWFELHDLVTGVGVELNMPKSGVQRSVEGTLGFIPFSPVKRGVDFVEGASLWMFNTAEKSNRLITAFGARRLGLEQGVTSPVELMDFARNFIERTQFQYAEIGLPPIMSGPMMRTLTQFKPFMFNQMKFETDLVLNALPRMAGGRGERGASRQWAAHMGLLGIVGGATGIAYSPYVFALASMAEMIGVFDAETVEGEYETSPDRTVENWLYRKFGRDFMSQGLNRYDNIYFQKNKLLAFGALGWLLNADISRRVSLSGPELFTTRMNDFGNLIVGPTGSMWLDFYKMLLDDDMRGRLPGRAQFGGVIASFIGGPTLGGFGGLIAGLGAASLLSTGAGKDDSPSTVPFVDFAQLYRNMTGQAKLGRSGSDGAFFETNSGRRFLANIMPTAVNMSDRAMDLAISGVDVDIGQNIYAAGVPEYNQGKEFFGHYFTNQQLNNGAIKLMGFNPANRTMDRWYINTIRDREKHRQEEASRIAQRIADAMMNGQDWTAFLLELEQLQIPYDKNKLSQRMRRGTVDMLTREIEDDLRSGLNSGRFNLGVP